MADVRYVELLFRCVKEKLHHEGQDAKFNDFCEVNSAIIRDRDKFRKQAVEAELAQQAVSPRSRGDLETLPTGFKLINKLGVGGCGQVFTAETPDGRKVAIKRVERYSAAVSPVNSSPGAVNATRSAQDRLYQRFIREQESLRELDDPNVVKFLGFSEDARYGYLIMELCKDSMRKLMPAAPFRPSADQVVKAMLQIANGVAAAHTLGIVHRDLKPENVLLGTDGRWKVADFGLVRLLGDRSAESFAETGEVVGTVKYMSYEQAWGRKVGYPTDVWSIGVMLYESLTGTIPFAGNNALEIIHQIQHSPPKELPREFPEDLRIIYGKCVRQNPGERYRDASRLASDLTSFLEGKSIAARPPSTRERVVEWTRQHPTRALAIFSAQVLLLAVAVVAALGYWQMAKQRDRADQNAGVAIDERNKADDNARAALAAVRESLTLFGTPDPIDTQDTRLLRRTATQAAAKHLASLAEHYRSDPRLQADAAEVDSLLGASERRMEQPGWGARAMTHLDRALLIQENLAKENPSSLNRVRLADTRRERGIALRANNKRDEALNDFDAALNMTKDLPPDLGRVLTLIHRAGLIDSLDQAGRREDARGGYQEAIRLCLKLADGWPNEPDRDGPFRREATRELAKAYSDLALFEQRHGTHDVTRDLYSSAISLRTKLATDASAALEPKNQLAAILNNAGLFEMTMTGNAPKAAQLLNESLRLRKELNSLLPGKYAILSGLGHCLQNLAIIRRRQGEAKEACVDLQEVFKLRVEAASLSPLGPFHLTYTLIETAESAREAHDLSAADNALSDAKQSLPRDDGAELKALDYYLLSFYHLSLGRVRRASGHFEQAIDALTKAHEYALKAGSAPEYLRNAAEALAEKGACQPNDGACAMGVSDFREALRLTDLACKQQPGHWEHEVARATAELHLGIAVFKTGSTDEAAEILRSADKHWKTLAERTPFCPRCVESAQMAADALAMTVTPPIH